LKNAELKDLAPLSDASGAFCSQEATWQSMAQATNIVVFVK
jgi:hypothetical protein